MKIQYKKSFLKDIRKVKDQKVKNILINVFHELKEANRVQEISGTGKLKGHANAYRVKIGAYRLGFFIEDECVIISRFLHRKDIYKYFP